MASERKRKDFICSFKWEFLLNKTFSISILSLLFISLAIYIAQIICGNNFLTEFSIYGDLNNKGVISLFNKYNDLINYRTSVELIAVLIAVCFTLTRLFFMMTGAKGMLNRTLPCNAAGTFFGRFIYNLILLSVTMCSYFTTLLTVGMKIQSDYDLFIHANNNSIILWLELLIPVAVICAVVLALAWFLSILFEKIFSNFILKMFATGISGIFLAYTVKQIRVIIINSVITVNYTSGIYFGANSFYSLLKIIFGLDSSSLINSVIRNFFDINIGKISPHQTAVVVIDAALSCLIIALLITLTIIMIKTQTKRFKIRTAAVTLVGIFIIIQLTSFLYSCINLKFSWSSADDELKNKFDVIYSENRELYNVLNNVFITGSNIYNGVPEKYYYLLDLFSPDKNIDKNKIDIDFSKPFVSSAEYADDEATYTMYAYPFHVKLVIRINEEEGDNNELTYTIFRGRIYESKLNSYK